MDGFFSPKRYVSADMLKHISELGELGIKLIVWWCIAR